MFSAGGPIERRRLLLRGVFVFTGLSFFSHHSLIRLLKQGTGTTIRTQRGTVGEWEHDPAEDSLVRQNSLNFKKGRERARRGPWSRHQQLLTSPLQRAFGDRLRGVVLYGSEARRDATAESDIDLLVLLTGPVALGQDLWTCIDVLYPMQLEMGRPIHPLPVDVEVYEKGEYALYRNARRDGVLV